MDYLLIIIIIIIVVSASILVVQFARAVHYKKENDEKSTSHEGMMMYSFDDNLRQMIINERGQCTYILHLADRQLSMRIRPFYKDALRSFIWAALYNFYL